MKREGGFLFSRSAEKEKKQFGKKKCPEKQLPFAQARQKNEPQKRLFTPGFQKEEKKTNGFSVTIEREDK